MKSYTHFSKEERFFIDLAFNQEKKSYSEIAKSLGKSKSSVYREIKRNSIDNNYVFDLAEDISYRRHWFTGDKFLKKYNDFSCIFYKFYDKRYCGVYATMLKIKQLYPSIKMPSSRQVYRWINSNKWVIKRWDRLHKRYKKGRNRTVGIFNRINQLYVKPIWVRPKAIDNRSEFGHWEGDLIVGKQERPYMNIFTFNERKTRMLFVAFVSSKNPWRINSLIRDLIKKNNLLVKSITFDNGTEFERIGILAKWLNIDIYQCEPYASFQRGSNENLNGIVRRFLPKGTNLNSCSLEQLNEIVDKINNMPRKIFNGKSSKEMYEKEKLLLKAIHL